MKFCILCIGTHGDVVPYVALGIQLKQQGHEVIVGAHEKARALCERHLLGYHPIGGDLSVQATPEETKELFEARGFKKLTSIFKLMNLFRGVLDVQFRDCLAAAQGAEVLIYNPVAFAGPHLAEYFKISAVRMNLQ